MRDNREDAETQHREKIANERRERAQHVSHDLEMQSAFTAGGAEKSYVSSPGARHSGSRRSPGKSRAPKAILAPVLIDKKANMSALQKKACVVLEEQIIKQKSPARLSSWAFSPSRWSHVSDTTSRARR
eukprot:Tamp_12228.p4 GENE.Tamp_12228~~Tamp_12228.p4  ORF type:complete len:129 (+),score=25.68 Tamp_12228:1307-1693(+)